jgi:hypothetical protein
MITKWDKSKKEPEEFYRFDDKETTLLHPAKHEEDLPRLFCVLQRNNVIDWNTFCLSDFIRSRKSKLMKIFNSFFFYSFSKTF